MVLVKRGETKEQFVRYYNVDNPIEVVKKTTVRSKDDVSLLALKVDSIYEYLKSDDIHYNRYDHKNRFAE